MENNTRKHFTNKKYKFTFSLSEMKGNFGGEIIRNEAIL